MPQIGDFPRMRTLGGEHNYIHAPYVWSGPSPPAGTYYWDAFPQFWNYRYIGDVPHKFRKNLPYWVKPQSKVQHTTIDTSQMGYLSGSWFTGGGNNEYWTFPSNTLTPPLSFEIFADITSVPDISDSDYFGLTREAFNYFSDAFPAVMSFSEFILGLRELRDLIPQVQDSMAKSFSGGYLNKEFGWDNLLSDLNTLGGIVQTARDRLQYLKRTYGVPTRLGFSRPFLDVTSHRIGDSWSWVWPGSTFTTTLTLQDIRVDFRATATILQTMDFLDGTIGVIRSLVGALGLNNPVKAIWVNLPFSFVVDWFFHISDHLDTLTQARPATGWDIYNVSSSVKAHYEFDVSFNITQDQRNVPLKCGTLKLDNYTRIPDLPLSVVDLLPTSELSPTQLTLMFALLHQQS